jgi:hypothetical protein
VNREKVLRDIVINKLKGQRREGLRNEPTAILLRPRCGLGVGVSDYSPGANVFAVAASPRTEITISNAGGILGFE